MTKTQQLGSKNTSSTTTWIAMKMLIIADLGLYLIKVMAWWHCSALL